LELADKGEKMIVISDMMGTLTTGSPVLGLVSWVHQHQSKFRADLYMAGMLPSYFLAKAGLIDWQKWGQSLMVNSLSLVRDATPETLAQIAEWAVERDLWPARREDVLARLEEHTQKGAQVYIASSVFEPTVAAFAKRIGAQAIGTPLEIVNGRVRLATNLVGGQHKIDEVLSRLGVQRVDVAYGDTAQDIPLLEHAEHPVAVYPDEALRATATKRGWEILGNKETG
jgi:phosphoserine phosphatase